MTFCPVALAVGCSKCPIVAVCPLKSVIGDYRAPVGAPVDTKAQSKARPKRGAKRRR